MVESATEAGHRNTDPRVLRTRVLLQEAVLQLATERDLGSITIADVAERATVNRATVYQHYGNRDELLLDAMEGELAALADLVARCPLVELPDTMPNAFVEVFRHVESQLVLYQRMLGPCGSARFIDRLQHLVAEQVMRQLAEKASLRRSSAFESRAHCAAGAFVGLIRHWVLNVNVLPARRAAAQAWKALTRQHGDRDQLEF
ncbi:TetR/AcrR family transcriptional regulator [Nocardia australiensis]|uniref:TetR/AcrR family transcriptional regulator n=1 Tax=Nocardia australiensis TaxID=2887191 RepID=UPI001D152C85|nr:TetR family transcriptional regulator [Nocardia australiensis]